MKIDYLKIYGAAAEIKEINEYLDKRILFHKSIAGLSDEVEPTNEQAQHLLICIELYDLKEFLYNRLLNITKELNLENNEQIL